MIRKARFIWILIGFLALTLAGCMQNAPAPEKTPDKNSQVETLVAETLAALPTQMASKTPAAAPTATLLPAAPTVQRPSGNQAAPTVQATSGNQAAPTATPTSNPTAAPTAVTAASAVATSASTSPTAQASTAAPGGTAPPDCIDKAAFVADVTIPDNSLMQKNQEFTKTWRIKNVGTCTWDSKYSFVFARGQILNGPPTSPMPTAAPDQIIDVSVKLKAPSDGGTYAGDWQFQNPAGKRFGVNSHGEDFIYLIIKVDWGPGIGPTAAPPPVNCSYSRNSNYEAQLLQLINAKRAEYKLSPFTLQNQLSNAALAHSADMACNNYLDHVGSDKSTYNQRIKATGYNAKNASENVYASGTAQDAFDWWMGSPAHRDNILSDKVTQIGIGHASYASSKYGDYYTLVFARP